MAPRNHELRTYDAGYNDARKHYDDDDLAGAIERAEDMLNDPRLPRYHRIRLLLLIAASAADWFVAGDLIERADVLVRMENSVRRRPDGEDPVIRELREELAAVKEHHQAEQPRDEDLEAVEDLDEAMEEARLEEEEFAEEDDFAGEEEDFADTMEDIVVDRDELAEEDEFVGGDAEAVAENHLEGSAVIPRGQQDDAEKVEEQRPSAGEQGKAFNQPFQPHFTASGEKIVRGGEEETGHDGGKDEAGG